MKNILLFFIFIHLITPLIVSAQPAIKFNSITSKDGLAGDFIYSLLQDKQGFLWIGTHLGLNRYDGYNFKLYEHNASDSNSISGNHIHCIKEDSGGILWLATNKGLNSLNPATGKIKRYTLPAGMSEYMKDIFLVNDSILLTHTGTTLYRFNKRTSLFIKINIPGNYPFKAGDKAKFVRDKQGIIYLAGGQDGNIDTSEGRDAVVINWKDARAAYLTSRDVLNALQTPGLNMYQLYFDTYNNAWCFTSGKGLFTKEVAGKKINYPYSVSDLSSDETVFNSFFEEPGKKLWMATGGGLVLYDYHINQFYRYRQQAGNNSSIPTNRVTTIIKDRKNVYWVGTFGGGLCYFTLPERFKNIITNSSSDQDDHIVRGMKILHSGRILCNTLSGKKLILEQNKTIHLEDPSTDFKNYKLLDSLVPELTGKPMSSFTANDAALLSAFFNATISPVSRKLYVTFQYIGDLFQTGNLVISDNKKVWVTYRRSLYDGKTHELDPPQQEPFCLLPMADENFLIGTIKGLFIYNTRTNSIQKSYFPEQGNPYSVSSSFIQCLLPDGHNNYWIGTADAGLDYWDRKTDQFHNYSTKDGLPDNTVYAILPDKYGRLWISTNKGLSCFDTSSKTFTSYDRYDGLINTEFNWASACIDQKGCMYFAGMDGIDYFHPDSFLQTITKPGLYVSGFKVHNQPREISTFYPLATQDNNIFIDFTTNDFLNASKTIYRYKLDKADEDWIVTRGINYALYNRLPPGNYHFTAQASYDNKNWSEPINISFSIATPWFQSWWFFSLVAAFTAGMLYYFFNYRLQQQLKILKIRNRIHRDLHDDVGATLSSVKAYSEILSNDPGNTVIAGLIKENAAEMIEQLETITWATSPQHDSFGSLVDKITRYALPACSARNIRFHAIENGIAREHTIPGEIRQTLYLVAKEAINNANKYSAAKDCFLAAEIDNDFFKMEISDNGTGFNSNGNGTGNGLRNIENRLKEAGGKAVITSTAGNGTTVSIYLPYPFKIPHIWDRKKKQ